MRRIIIGLAVLLVAGSMLGSIGCSGKAAATAAVTTAQTAFDAVKDNAAKVLPEDTQKLSDVIAAAKADIEQGKVKEAMETAKTLPDQIKALADNAAKKKDELTATWTSMSAELPKDVEALQTKVDELSKVKKLPAGLDATAFAGVKDSLAGMKQAWTDAQAAFTSGNLAEALAKAGTIKQALVTAMTTLKMEIPAALQAS
jgi:hypothetical protein